MVNYFGRFACLLHDHDEFFRGAAGWWAVVKLGGPALMTIREVGNQLGYTVRCTTFFAFVTVIEKYKSWPKDFFSLLHISTCLFIFAWL